MKNILSQRTVYANLISFLESINVVCKTINIIQLEMIFLSFFRDLPNTMRFRFICENCSLHMDEISNLTEILCVKFELPYDVNHKL